MPDVAIPMQHGLLKRISAFQSKEVGLGASLYGLDLARTRQRCWRSSSLPTPSRCGLPAPLC